MKEAELGVPSSAVKIAKKYLNGGQFVVGAAPIKCLTRFKLTNLSYRERVSTDWDCSEALQEYSSGSRASEVRRLGPPQASRNRKKKSMIYFGEVEVKHQSADGPGSVI